MFFQSDSTIYTLVFQVVRLRWKPWFHEHEVSAHAQKAPAAAAQRPRRHGGHHLRVHGEVLSKRPRGRSTLRIAHPKRPENTSISCSNGCSASSRRSSRQVSACSPTCTSPRKSRSRKSSRWPKRRPCITTTAPRRSAAMRSRIAKSSAAQTCRLRRQRDCGFGRPLLLYQ